MQFLDNSFFGCGLQHVDKVVDVPVVMQRLVPRHQVFQFLDKVVGEPELCNHRCSRGAVHRHGRRWASAHPELLCIGASIEVFGRNFHMFHVLALWSQKSWNYFLRAVSGSRFPRCSCVQLRRLLEDFLFFLREGGLGVPGAVRTRKSGRYFNEQLT